MSLPNELLPVGLLGTGASEGYTIERSVRFNSSDSEFSAVETAQRMQKVVKIVELFETLPANDDSVAALAYAFNNFSNVKGGAQ